MKLIYCVIVIIAVFVPHSQAYQPSVIIQHKASQKFVGWYNGVPGTIVTFTSNVENAQRFQLEVSDSGTIYFITNDGAALWDKQGSCDSDKNYLIYFANETGNNQVFTLNNDGTIGSKCCDSCLLVPNSEMMLLTIDKKVSCNTNLTNYQFSIFPVGV